MKFICLTFWLLFSLGASAQVCKVYGISDGPQKLTCQFKKLEVRLHCENGDYFVDDSKVNNAYHLEVEEGSSPLVFKTAESELTVVVQSKTHIDAEFIQSGIVLTGTCQ